jgi:hypothetical protein
MGGIGKTSLVARLAQEVSPAFERVHWRSLRDAPLPSDWLASAIGFLSDHPPIRVGTAILPYAEGVLKAAAHKKHLLKQKWVPSYRVGEGISQLPLRRQREQLLLRNPANGRGHGRIGRASLVVCTWQNDSKCRRRTNGR